MNEMKGIKGKIMARFIIVSLVIFFLVSQVVWALPQGDKVVAGKSTISKPSPTSMQINQTTGKSIINWQGYSIGKNEAVTYKQPHSSSISLNRVVGTDPSRIYGQLSANGQVWVINPNGLLVGKGAKINVGSFLGSTLNITDNDFLNGKYRFINTTGSLSSITNLGDITANKGGYVVLISPTITNKGNISSKLGKAYLASGDKVTLTFANDNLIGFNIDKETADALIKNTGKISANGGEAILSAKSAGDLLKTVINNKGIIEAQTIENRDGKIYLLGGMKNNAISVGGTLDASAPKGGDGGFIETSAAKVKVADDAKITTYAPYGTTGEWLIDPNDYTIAPSGGDITGATLSNNLNTSDVTIQSSSGSASGNGDINVNDAVSWSADTTLTLSAYHDINVNSNITATGNMAGLTLTPNTGSSGGNYHLNNGAVITLSGTTPSLTIAGNAYTVINSLGAEGSVTGTDLQGMQGNLSGHYALGSNIDAGATLSWNGGEGFLPVGNFTGTFDGLGHTISGLTINRSGTDYIGLFDSTSGSTIQNVGLVNADITGNRYVGGLVGENSSYGTISNSYSTGKVTGSGRVGGLVGWNYYGTISNSYSTGKVTGSGYVGGLVGQNDSSGTISNSYATGSVTSSSGTDVGGLVGYNHTGTISNSYATGDVSGDINVGGLVGYNDYSSVSNSYATGSVTSSSGTYVGGLVGYSYNSTIANSYATGDVSGNTVGGLVGWNYGTITNSYSTGSVTGTYVGGLVGWNNGTITNSYWDTGTSGQSSSAGGTGLSTADMMTTSSFTNWDFSNIWWMNDGNTRPFLRSEYSRNINNAHQLQLMSIGLTASYTLGKDINMEELSQASGLWNTTTGFLPVGNSSNKFTGTFDGLGHTITGLTINRSGTDNVGLFGCTDTATIQNVGLANVKVSGNSDVGGLVGYAYHATISNSYSTGSVSGDNYVGGLVGTAGSSTHISNSYSTGSVSGNSDVGGLVGYAYYSTTISNSYSTGDVSNNNNYVGGLVGYAEYSTILNSYSTGSVNGNNDVGGLVGYAYYSTTISNSYSTGSVSGNDYVGGFAGYNAGNTFSNNFWDIDTSGTSTGVGYGSSSGVTGKTTSEMKEMATFSDAGWDIANTGGAGKVWRIYEGYTYPLLSSFLTPITVTADDVSKTYDGTAWNNEELQNVNYNGADTTKIFNKSTPYGENGVRNAGTYTPKLYSNQQGYDITYANGALTINPAPLTITANDITKTYGDEITFAGTEFTSQGLVNSETIGKVDLASDGAPATAPVSGSPYDIIPSNATGGTFDPNNYDISYVNGKLTVISSPSSSSTAPIIRDMYQPMIKENYSIHSYATKHNKGNYVSFNSANFDIDSWRGVNYLIIDKRHFENINHLYIESPTKTRIR